MTPGLAFLAAALAVPAAWEALAAAGGAALRPVRRVLRSDAEPSAGESRRLALLALLGVGVAGGLLVGPAGAVAGALGGPVVLRLLLAVRAARRSAALRGAAAPVARALADALAGGASSRRALTDAAHEGAVPGVAGAELRRLAAGLHAGEALEPALRGWRRRVDDPAHTTIAAALLLQQRTGGELADVLREQATALEDARRTQAEAESATVQARTAARIVAAVPLLGAGGTVLFAPEAVRGVASTPIGGLLLAAAAILLVVALVLVGRLTRRPS